MNTVSVIGQVTAEPDLRRNRAGEDECRMRIAVPRRNRAGGREPGVVYLDVTTFGAEARECAERLSVGDRIGLSGRLDVDEHVGADGAWETAHGVVIDQLDLLEGN